ncbi:amphi-Trp domain-containing protein [archaeon SCG-AAA382B04]|nr:amphi-Trp domain-containing protein [archaeon SCG-AAA382B04]
MDVKEQEPDKDKKRVTGSFQQEIYMEREDLANFLEELAKELKQGNEIKIITDEWELPFAIRDQAEVEIELEHGELEIKLELEFDEDKSKDLTVE